MTELPYAIAVVAGMLAVLNPCGFALLPGYVALLVASGDDPGAGSPGARWRSLRRALSSTVAMTSGFVLVFAGFGLVVTPLALSVEPYLPWVTVVAGAVLVGLGGWLLSGRDVSLVLPKPGAGQPVRSLRWAAVYGLSYAIASLSCTIGPFLALVTSALSTTSAVGMVTVFLAYAAGMGLVVAVVSVATALARDTVAARLRRALPYVTRASGALLVLAGAYVTYYGWFELRVFSGAAPEDPLVGTATDLQADLSRWLQGLGPGWVAAALALLLAAGAATAVWRARRGAEGASSGTPPAA